MKSLLRLKPYLRPYFGLILTSLLLGIPLAALRTSPVVLLEYFGNTVLPKKSAHAILLFSLGIVGLFILNFIVRFFHYYLMRIVIARVNQKIKNDLYEHLLGLSADYFTSQTTGTLTSRVGYDPNQVDQGLSCLNLMVREPVQFLLALGFVFYKNWQLTLITFLIFPPLAWVFTTTGRNLKRYVTRFAEENAKMYSTLQESLVGIRVIKMFRLEKYVRKKFRQRSDDYTKFHLKIAALEEAAHPLVELLMSIIVALMLYFGGMQILAGKLTFADLMAFFTAFLIMINPIRNLNDLNMKLHQTAAACDRIFEVFDWKPNLHEPAQPRPILGLRSEIKLEDVSFAYPDHPARLVLKDVSFILPRGKVVALVGASGSGKSSLASLLPRIFDVTRGAIRIDGHDIRELELESLRKLIAVVSQDVFLFNDTIEENIRCGRLSATREEIREAARKAHALDFIEGSPNGFQTLIGERGQKLSGGERQRISIARAFLREAPILILDEATSALDSASERAVQKALDELMVDRTTLVIAHRLSTIRHADQILVLRDGEIIERGRHDELVKLGGEYSRFHSGTNP